TRFSRDWSSDVCSSDLDFEWYRSFVAIYRAGSVSAAAASRHLTQPALSQHLAALEAEVGEPLFHRRPRKMVPTERGIALYRVGRSEERRVGKEGRCGAG